MKSYNVKSNAKRFARQLAAKHPGYIADEPVPVNPEFAIEWFPHVAAPTKVLAAGIPEEISGTAYVNGKPVMTTIPFEMTIGAESVTITKPASVGVSEAPLPYEQAVEALLMDGGPVVMTLGAMKAAVADLPPTKSTPEEIAARRAARAARVAEPKPAKVAKSTKADTILELVSVKNGATIAEIMSATDWQAHTVRGYIAGTLRKRGHNIVSKKIKGEETRYVIPRPEVEA